MRSCFFREICPQENPLQEVRVFRYACYLISIDFPSPRVCMVLFRFQRFWPNVSWNARKFTDLQWLWTTSILDFLSVHIYPNVKKMVPSWVDNARKVIVGAFTHPERKLLIPSQDSPSLSVTEVILWFIVPYFCFVFIQCGRGKAWVGQLLFQLESSILKSSNLIGQCKL